MSSRRLEFHEILVKLLDSRNVYFQPPSTIKMQYPCIIYKRSSVNTEYANNLPYNSQICYTVFFISPNPDSDILDKILAMPLSKFDRHYTADNLNHDIFNIYY